MDDRASASSDRRWAFTTPTPVGDVHAVYEVDDEGLRFESDAIVGGGSHRVAWAAVKEGGTASLDTMPTGLAPDLPRWVPGRMEWLVLSLGSGGASFMQILPPAPARAELVAEVERRLGGRWRAGGMPLAEARRHFVPGARGETFKVVVVVLAVFACLAALVLVLMVLLSPPVVIPAGFALGAHLFRRGLVGFRDVVAVENTPTARVSSAAMGLVELEGRVASDRPVAAGVSGLPSAGWDVVVECRYDDRDHAEWRHVAARYGGTMDAVDLEDDSGRVPIWLKDAELLLRSQEWQNDQGAALPPAGAALVASMGLAWQGPQRLRVRETRLEVGAPLYVLGTLAERRDLPDDGRARGVARALQVVRTGEWRTGVARRLPEFGQVVFGALVGLLDMWTKLGRGGERPRGATDSAPPAVAPDRVLVWKGRGGRPFVVSNQPAAPALSALRRRALWRLAAGGGLLCYCLYELVHAF